MSDNSKIPVLEALQRLIAAEQEVIDARREASVWLNKPNLPYTITQLSELTNIKRPKIYWLKNNLNSKGV